MTSAERLIEQHVREYESRLKHVDELLTRAHSQAAGTPEEAIERELAELTESRDELARHVEQLRHSRSLPDQSEEGSGKGGPMGVWDAIASQLEKLIERLER